MESCCVETLHVQVKWTFQPLGTTMHVLNIWVWGLHGGCLFRTHPLGTDWSQSRAIEISSHPSTSCSDGIQMFYSEEGYLKGHSHVSMSACCFEFIIVVLSTQLQPSSDIVPNESRGADAQKGHEAASCPFWASAPLDSFGTMSDDGCSCVDGKTIMNSKQHADMLT